jgi:hypothetical protein
MSTPKNESPRPVYPADYGNEDLVLSHVATEQITGMEEN